MSIPLLSFFTGGGFLDIGFEQAGFDIIWTNEIDPAFAEMHKHGMSAWRKSVGATQRDSSIFNCNSITYLQPDKVRVDAFGESEPKIFGVIGGPPCTDFSVGGKNGGAKGEHGKLTQVFVDLVCGIRPDFFVMENVPGLYKTKKHHKFLTSIINQLEHANIGYLTTTEILSSFGIWCAAGPG